MSLPSTKLAAAALACFATSSFAQVSFPEVEPNSQKSEATAVAGIVSGDSITGTSTGAATTLGDVTLGSADVFRVKTGAALPGIYKHTLTLTSAVVGHTATIRGIGQTAGVPNGTDVEFQLASTASTPPRSNVWFGFGKQEEIYYRVAGAAATTAAYAATLTTVPVTPTVVATNFSSGLVTITSVGQTTTDTEIYVYDANFNPVAGYHNDDEGPLGGSFQSRVTRVFAPGVYYVVVSDYNIANNQPDANSDEDFLLGNILDFPDALCSNDRETTAPDYDVAITDSVGTVPVTLLGGLEFDMVFAQITVVPGPPPANDTCANAAPITTSTQGYLPGATNDGAASCDTGGALSRDLWYSFTAGPSGGTISPETCTGGPETVLTVYAACGGSELGCNDDCVAGPCGGPSSCLTGLVVAPNQTVLVRVSDKGTGTGLFTLKMNYVPQPPINDDCTTPIVLPGPGVYPFDTTLATTGAQGQGTTVACATTTSVKKDLWYTYTASTNGSVTFSTCALTTSVDTDTKIAYYTGAGCPVAASPVGCDDDACVTPTLNSILTFNVTCGEVFSIQLGNYGAAANITGSFSVTETGTNCSTPSTAFCTGDAVGTTCVLCGNNGAAGRGCANSSFASGTLLASSGIASVSADTLVLTTTDVTGPGLFFQANGLAPSPINFGDGMLCAAAGILRLGVVFPTAGTASYPGGLTPNPITVGGGPIASGDVKHYQCWYRDAIAFCSSSTFNTSNGVTLTWGP